MPLNVLSIDVEIIDNKFEMRQFLDITKFQDKIAVLCIFEDSSGGFYKAAVLLYNNGVWEKLPTEIGDSSNKSYILCTLSSMINFDSTGNLWVSGTQMYKYSNGKWEAYSIKDNDSPLRKYEQFVVDKFNNLWITSFVFDRETSIGYSELLKYDGNEFESVLKFDVPISFKRIWDVFATGSSIAALPDGRIVLQRTFYISEEDVINKRTEDIYFINQDKTYERKKLLTPSGPEFNEHNKNIMAIYPESNERIWFCLSTKKYIDGSECCSGLTLYENGNWKIFTEENGFEKKPTGNYKPIYRIIKTLDDNYFLIGNRETYLLDKNFFARKLSWENILNHKCKLIISSSYFNGENGIKELQGFYDNTLQSPIIGGIFIHNGQFWIQFSKGILIFDEAILSVDKDVARDTSIKVYPNPASDFIRLEGTTLYDTFHIVNSLGETVMKGIYNNSEINLTGLPAGFYIIRLFQNNQLLKQLTFIKY